MFRKIIACIMLSPVLSMISTINAATESTKFNVKLRIVPTCDISSISPTEINFEEVDPFSMAGKSATGKITVRCTNLTGYTMLLNGGSSR
ncbi:hypothetical protein DUU53_25475 [Salmonella enterica subsp. enterica serovar Berlin]|nr:hypothetical protein [Salmonella enterica subsp. enterica serovar Berlin]